MKNKIIQRRNPKTKRYVKISKAGKRPRILSSSKTPFKGVPRK